MRLGPCFIRGWADRTAAGVAPGPERELRVLHGILSAFYMWPKKGRYDLTVTRNIVYAFLAVRLFGVPTVYELDDALHPVSRRELLS